MTDLFGSIVWLVGSVALLALLWIAYYAITKIGTLLTGRPVEVDFMFFLGGALIGMLFLPSGDHATAESRLMLAFAIIAGGFFGGLIGLFVDIYSSRKPSSNSGSPHAEGTASSQNWSLQKAISRIGGFLFVLLLVICGAIVIAVRLGDMPIVSPLIQYLRQFL